MTINALVANTTSSLTKDPFVLRIFFMHEDNEYAFGELEYFLIRFITITSFFRTLFNVLSFYRLISLCCFLQFYYYLYL